MTADLMGDGATARFGSVVDVVACAVALQKETKAGPTRIVRSSTATNFNTLLRARPAGRWLGRPSGRSLRWSCRRSHPAETGRLDRQVGPGCGNVESLLYNVGFGVLAQPHQAFMIAMQAPDVLWMLTGSRQSAVEAEVGHVDRLRFLYSSPFQQERPQGMTRRLHPRPGFVIRQIVVELDRLPQVGEG